MLAASEQGQVTLLKVTPEKGEVLSEMQLGNEIFASPILVKGKLYLRSGSHSGGKYAETLTCIRAE